MTRRSAAPPSPDLYAREFVTAVLRVIDREAVNRRTAVRLIAALGGGWELWQLEAEPRLVAKHPVSGAALAAAARAVTRASLGRLAVGDAGWLSRTMRDGRDEPGSQPAHFKTTLDIIEDGSWALRLSAHYAHGGSCTVAEFVGVVVEPAHQAAA